MKQIFFSIIMPFYNSESYVERAVLSVINQTYNNWELIAINDGSTDQSEKIVSYYARHDSRIKIVCKENGGYATAINCGINNLSDKSDYFLMLGSDDELNLNVLKEIATRLHSFSYDMIGFMSKRLFDNGREEYDEMSFVDKDITECDIDLITFYEKHDNINQHFVVRDTARCYKTILLGSLRYFGKYGISSDGIFSMLFAYKCNSFAHFTVDGYRWHVRNDSVSQTKRSISKIVDSFNNWKSFFKIVVDNKYQLTNYSKQYMYMFLNDTKTVIGSEKSVFKNQKNNIIDARKIILLLAERYDLHLSKKDYFALKFMFFYRLFRHFNKRNITNH